MIKKCTDENSIVRLWQQAFGDSEEEILYFIYNARHAECFAEFVNNEAVSMLFLVDCDLQSRKAKYIYAVCTAEKHRRKGYSSELIEYCKEKYNLLCLIPADDGLIDFYKRLQFNTKASIESLHFDENEEICEYLFDGFNLTEPMVLCYNKEK